ncbi:MAG: histidinol-phosphate aminotransferase family protein [Proteobacteria bacterium]|nr:histidinol-phosphate aminotransferase family protein [Pseudomonadota bacterium]
MQNQKARERQYEALADAHGGYWRYGFIDHAYLYNLHFPPERFFELIKSQIHELVLNYPVAQATLAGWVGDLIDQPAERIVVGNGAAELIKIVSGSVAKKLIVPVPSFNEYANAAPEGTVVEFALEIPSFQLDVDKFAAEAIRCEADVAVVVTPNNPTSLSVPKADLVRLLKKLDDHNCMLIVDESFIDFVSDRERVTLEKDIAQYPNLAIFKSMSKAYGICGLRIGYMLTANEDFAGKVRAGIHIWNLNGFAETFLKMAPEYREEFESSCVQVRKDRDLFYHSLCSIDGLLVFKPDANFVFCRLPDHAPSGPEVARSLFVEHNIYIKHCQGKSMPDSDRYVRIASRTPDENKHLVNLLGEVIATGHA